MKPNTVCQIRGITNHRQQNMNGMIVLAKHLNQLFTKVAKAPVWEFEPPLQDKQGCTYNHALQQHLHPLDSCEDQLAHEALDRALEHV